MALHDHVPTVRRGTRRNHTGFLLATDAEETGIHVIMGFEYKRRGFTCQEGFKDLDVRAEGLTGHTAFDPLWQVDS